MHNCFCIDYPWGGYVCEECLIIIDRNYIGEWTTHITKNVQKVFGLTNFSVYEKVIHYIACITTHQQEEKGKMYKYFKGTGRL